MLRALKKKQSEHPPLELMKHSLIEAAEYRIQVGTRKKNSSLQTKPCVAPNIIKAQGS